MHAFSFSEVLSNSGWAGYFRTGLGVQGRSWRIIRSAALRGMPLGHWVVLFCTPSRADGAGALGRHRGTAGAWRRRRNCAGRRGSGTQAAEPGVLERLVHAGAVPRLDGHEPAHEALRLGRHGLPLAGVELEAPPEDLLVEPLLLEGGGAAEQDVEDHAEAPHVDLLPVPHGVPNPPQLGAPARGDHLGREVVRGAAEGPAVACLHVLPRQPEVRDLGVHRASVLGRQQDVVGLEVAVHDAPRVQVGHRLAESAEEPAGLRLGEAAACHDALEKVAPRDELHHEVEVRVRLEPAVELDDPRVLEAREHLGLAAEAQPRPALPPELLERLLLDDLHGPPLPAAHLDAQAHLAEVAAPKARPDVPVLLHPMLCHVAAAGSVRRVRGHGLVACNSEDVCGERL
mmetsp:Transcript_70945/g.200242  ORF Transcript_70945/g.200242 Transcript_70945/m.200242 type:complete len:400 (+) Transcript_70945:52-1251(+)